MDGSPITLVLLAAGRSTRFGRPKQWEPIGPRGEAIIDLTLRDAFANGCDRAMIVARPEHHEQCAQRCAADRRIAVVEQAEALGTAHAAMLAVQRTPSTVVIANGDDLYGGTSMRMALEHAREASSDEHALIGFRLANTLSAGGPVNRAICAVDEQGFLTASEEVSGLAAAHDGSIVDHQHRPWRADAVVSMNLWVFRPIIFPLCATLYTAERRTGEFGLPHVVGAAIAQGQRFRALSTPDQWYGLTHPDDVAPLRRALSSRS